MRFPQTIKAQLLGSAVRMDYFVEFQFRGRTIRVWNGFGSIRTNDGRVWEGLAGLGSIDGLAQAVNGAAPSLSLTVSGVDERFAGLAREDRDEYYHRPVLVFLQFFDEAWQCLDLPFAIAARQMETVRSTRSQEDDGSVTRTVTLTAETPFVTRRRPAYGYLTDRDQQMRFPGDRGLERVAGIDGKNITFPDA